ncbi:MAG: ATP-binding protein [Verrucomicrobiota bacterium]
MALPLTKGHLKQIACGLEDPNSQGKLTTEIERLEFEFKTELARLEARYLGMDKHPDMVASLANITSLIRVIWCRVAEFEHRKQAAEIWESPTIEEVRRSLVEFLDAMQRNAKGRYRVVLESENKLAGDYRVALEIRSTHGSRITLPPIMQDVTRDLLANARKYTPPGGTIQVHLIQDDPALRLVVSDNGRGIPETELDKVVDFGYRASNVRDIPTKGGGFGLTKAYWVTKRLGGRFWIQSILGQGTQITIHIPMPS